MKNTTLLTIMLLLLNTTMVFGADNPSLEDIQKRLEELEAKSTGIINKVSENLSIGGLIEVEAGGEDNNQSGEDSSDIALATIELGLDSEVAENISGHVLLLWEEGEGPVEVDEGTIEIQSSYGLGLIAGKQYIPFGNFESHFISDPLTLELGETNESALLLTYGIGWVELTAGVFNGDIDKTGDDKVDNFSASLTLTPSDNFTIGASYISDIADTDSDITAGTLELSGATTITEHVEGVSGFINLTLGSFNLIGEYLGAGRHFSSTDLEQVVDGKDEKPYAYNV